MRKYIILLLLTLPLIALGAEDKISFSGGYSKVTLAEGKETLILSNGARVQIGSLSIEAEEINLSGKDYSRVECNGSVLIQDEEKGLTIRTRELLYDRSRETLLISSWCEISDTINEMEATAASLYYDMNNEILRLQMRVSLLMNTDDGILKATAEDVTYNRNANTLVLSGGAEVSWRGDDYNAKAVMVNLTDNTISLEGRIEGTVNG